jgi:hypothetical protein
VHPYNYYEPTSVDHLTELHGTRQEAVGALMGRFATREDEVDDLFRLGVFVDLYRVVRQGVRAGVELFDQAARAAVRVRPAGGPARSDGQPDRVRGGPPDFLVRRTSCQRRTGAAGGQRRGCCDRAAAPARASIHLLWAGSVGYTEGSSG